MVRNLGLHNYCFLTDGTISLIAPTVPVNEDVGVTQMCCAQITDLPSGGLGCPLIATLTLVDGSKAGMHTHRSGTKGCSSNSLLLLITCIHFFFLYVDSDG